MAKDRITFPGEEQERLLKNLHQYRSIHPPRPVQPIPKPLSPRELLRQKLGLDTIGKPSPKKL